MATGSLKKMGSIDAQLRLIAPSKVSEDDKLVEYDALLLDRFLDILQDLHGEEVREFVCFLFFNFVIWTVFVFVFVFVVSPFVLKQTMFYFVLFCLKGARMLRGCCWLRWEPQHREARGAWKHVDEFGSRRFNRGHKIVLQHA